MHIETRRCSDPIAADKHPKPSCRQAAGKRQRLRGFSLVELMATLCVIGLLMGVGVPAYESLVEDNRLVTNVNELVAAIHYARSEAIKRGAPVRICIANNSSINAGGCSGGSDWSAGWNVRIVGGAVLQRRAPMQGAETLDEIGSPTNDGRITFDRLGFTADTRTVISCNADDEATRARGLIVNVVGQVRTAADTNGDNIVEDAGGTNVACP